MNTPKGSNSIRLSDAGLVSPGDKSKERKLPVVFPPDAVRSTVCGSAVKFNATMTGGAPGALRSQLKTFVFSVSSIVLAPRASATFDFLSRMRVRYQARSELGSFSSVCTLMVEALGGTGSQG